MAPGGQRLGLGRSSKIKSGRDFTRIKLQGQRVTLGSLVANWAPAPATPKSRVAVVTSRRVGNAVCRNRARRLLREAFRLHQHELAEPVELVLIARPSISGKSFGQVETDLLSILRKAKLLTRAEELKS